MARKSTSTASKAAKAAKAARPAKKTAPKVAEQVAPAPTVAPPELDLEPVPPKKNEIVKVSKASAGPANYTLHLDDLPAGLEFGPVVAVDTETMGLNPHRDRLCLVQLSSGDGHAHLVQLRPKNLGGRGYDCPNLRRLMADHSVTKLMHFARFDVGVLQHRLNCNVQPVKCTKIAAKLVRTFTERHGLRDLCRELLGVEISKVQQTSDWGAAELTHEQLAYAASDVLYLHALWDKLEALLQREGRLDLANACFRFLPARTKLDMLGYEEPDIFHH